MPSQAGAKPQLLMGDVFHLLCSVLLRIRRFFTPKCENLCHFLRNGDYVAFGNGCICKPIYFMFVLLHMMSRITFARVGTVNKISWGLQGCSRSRGGWGGHKMPPGRSVIGPRSKVSAPHPPAGLSLTWWSRRPLSRDCWEEKPKWVAGLVCSSRTKL